MSHKKLLLLAAFVALLGSASVGSGAYARNGSDDTSGSSRSGREARAGVRWPARGPAACAG